MSRKLYALVCEVKIYKSMAQGQEAPGTVAQSCRMLDMLVVY